MPRVKPLARIIAWALEILHRRLRRHVSVLEGIRIQICPNVFNPVIGRTTAFFIRNMIIPRDAKVLELGTGTGAIAASAARYTTRVVATDINPFAVKCAKATMRLNNAEDSVEVIEGDLFTPVQGHQFDVILFNPPYFSGTPRGLLAQAWYAGPHLEVINRFLTEARVYLAPEGIVQILFSSIAPLHEFIQMISRSKFQLEILGRGKLGLLEHLYLFQLS